MATKKPRRCDNRKAYYREYYRLNRDKLLAQQKEYYQKKKAETTPPPVVKLSLQDTLMNKFNDSLAFASADFNNLYKYCNELQEENSNLRNTVGLQAKEIDKLRKENAEYK
jgi:hypothetical protein